LEAEKGVGVELQRRAALQGRMGARVVEIKKATRKKVGCTDNEERYFLWVFGVCWFRSIRDSKIRRLRFLLKKIRRAGVPRGNIRS
jgi:hypothetical protein